MLRTQCPHCKKPLAIRNPHPASPLSCPFCNQRFCLPEKMDAPKQVVENAPAAEFRIVEAKELRRERQKASDEIVVDDVAEAADVEEVRRPRRRKRPRRTLRPQQSVFDKIGLSYMAQTNIGVALGLIFHGIGLVLMKTAGLAGLCVGLPIFLVGEGCYIWGCCAYAKMNGQPTLFGLFGLIGCIGLIILIALPYRSPDDE